MDIFPAFLRAAGGDPAEYELDGFDVMSMVADGAESPHEAIFWERGEQTAVRRGPWKVVLNGYVVEGATDEDKVHLSYLPQDRGERVNLKDEYPDLTAELRAAAETWRADIENRWQARQRASCSLAGGK